jgi:hypothetical protein
MNTSFNNAYTFDLTGTSFGRLDSFKKSTYIHGYEFIDVLGNDVSYSNTLCGGPLIPFKVFTSELFYEEISEPILWLDGNEVSNLEIVQGGIVNSIKDKTVNEHLFEEQGTSSIITTAHWFGVPVTETNYSVLSDFESEFKTCFRIGANVYFSCDTFLLNSLSSFYCYFFKD